MEEQRSLAPRHAVPLVPADVGLGLGEGSVLRGPRPGQEFGLILEELNRQAILIGLRKRFARVTLPDRALQPHIALVIRESRCQPGVRGRLWQHRPIPSRNRGQWLFLLFLRHLLDSRMNAFEIDGGNQFGLGFRRWIAPKNRPRIAYHRPNFWK